METQTDSGDLAVAQAQVVGHQVVGSTDAQSTMAKLIGNVCKICHVLFYTEHALEQHETHVHHAQEQYIDDLQARLMKAENDMVDAEHEIESLKKQLEETESERDELRDQVEDIRDRLR